MLASLFLLFLTPRRSIALQTTDPLPYVADFGVTTLTHYDLPLDYVASCGCVARSTHYPTAAINALVYGSTISFGPSCGVCYRLALLTTPYSPLPPLGDGTSFPVNDTRAPSVIVKITDVCPVGGQWCSQSYNATTNVSVPNVLGSMIHFDLAWPSIAIPASFYPLDATHADYGVWTATYEKVDCARWAGYRDPASWGSDWSQQDSACCPMLSAEDANESKMLPESFNVTAQQCLCPSYSAPNADQQVPNTSNILSKTIEANQAFKPIKPTMIFAPLITGLLATLA